MKSEMTQKAHFRKNMTHSLKKLTALTVYRAFAMPNVFALLPIRNIPIKTIESISGCVFPIRQVFCWVCHCGAKKDDLSLIARLRTLYPQSLVDAVYHDVFYSIRQVFSWVCHYGARKDDSSLTTGLRTLYPQSLVGAHALDPLFSLFSASIELFCSQCFV